MAILRYSEHSPRVICVCPILAAAEVALVGWPGLAWARGLGLTKVISLLQRTDPASIHAIKLKGNINHGTC